MSTMGLRSASELAISQAMDGGADQADIIATRGNSFSLSAQKGEIDKYKVSSSQVLGIRIIKDSKVGLCYTEAIDPTAINHMVKQAITVAQFSGVDEFQTISISESERVESNPDIFQPDNTPVSDKIKLSLTLEREAIAANDKVKNSPYNGYADGQSEMVYLNHLGTYCYHRERSFTCYTSALAEYEGKQAMYGYSMVGRNFKELDPTSCVNEVIKYAIPLLQGKSVPTKRYDLVFSLDEQDQIFGAFAGALSGRAAMEGKSVWREKIGSSVADSRITLRDLPKYRDGFYFNSFDDEGAATKDLTLIDAGVLKSHYHNTSTAKFFGLETTGHASRSPRGGLGISGSQVVISPGSDEESQVNQGTYIKVIGLKGLHSGTNAISGQFSLAIDGILYENGGISQYVRDATISGNFYQLLNQIEAVGNILHANSSKSFFSPLIRFRDVSVAGS